MDKLTKSDVLKLSVAERIQLVEDIWDTIADNPEEVPLSEEKKAELDRRLVAHQQNPDAAIPGDTVLKKIRSRRGAGNDNYKLISTTTVFP